MNEGTIPGQTPEDVVVDQPRKSGNPDEENSENGLAELEKTDKIVVQQIVEIAEACCWYEGKKSFSQNERLGLAEKRCKVFFF